jgi:hypothetical protein
VSAASKKTPRRYYAVCWSYGAGCHSERITAKGRVITTPIRRTFVFASRAERDEYVAAAHNPYDPGAPGYCEPIERRLLRQAEIEGASTC